MFVVVVCCERVAPAPFSLTLFRMYPARAHVQSQPLSARCASQPWSSPTLAHCQFYILFLYNSFLEKLEDCATQKAEGEGPGRDHGTGASLNRAGSGRRRSSRSRSSRRRAGPRRSPRDAARGTRACNASKRVS